MDENENIVSIEESDPELHQLLVKWCESKVAKKNPFIISNERLFVDFGNGGPIREVRFKVGPNESCPCGSGRKYKKCCEGKE